MLLTEALPGVAAEIARGLLLAAKQDLAEQVTSLELVDRCRCEDDFCATFYTQPNEPWEGRTVERFIFEMPGLGCVVAVDGAVAWVELFWRPEVRNRLQELLPRRQEPRD